ncbi:hypothetical protein BDF20DRAFT_813497 [Mycotypha africana]|uniref:uncharacterized protein n=1 Tax=Mycotypha africana TaxID=64632 RepID=UPI002300BDBF|nr:uncharacterized protein BDF20DRAFT_813497 [Mycotypha africana]KAI8988630.1 hypothetical protein BDF20DRAFT_813497 [Mycotypha africana]
MQAFIVEESAESIEEDITDEDAIADEDNDDDICSSYTSTSSIPDEDINFDLVYARHTFVASIDGQASVVKGDTMVLIDDTNSYWWLIRALKTSEVGYIPAELVETPHERLARLNKHRNVESSFTNFDVTATTSKSRIAKKRVRLSRTLACQKQILFYSNYDDDIEIDKDIDSYTATYEEYTEEIPLSTYLASENDENFTLNTTTDGESINQDDMTDKHYHVLRIFAGDSIQTGTSYNTVTITPEMNADELLKLTLQKFHISLMDDSVTSSGIEFYLTVKSMDSDEITLMPQDKPLSIFESLSDHLTEPMPSLKILKPRKRAQARFGDDSLIRFSLHKRIKRVIDEVDCDNIEHMYIKLFEHKDKKERFEKLVPVSITTTINELIGTALEKFHIATTIPMYYYMTLSISDEGNFPAHCLCE